jgi:hypothetical protein
MEQVLVQRDVPAENKASSLTQEYTRGRNGTVNTRLTRLIALEGAGKG